MELSILLIVLVAALVLIGAYVFSAEFGGNAKACSSKVASTTQPIGPLAIRLREEKVNGKRTFIAQRIEARGRFPVVRKMHLGFMVSVVDVTDRRQDDSAPEAPLVSRLEEHQEPDSTCYLGVLDIGDMDSGQCWLAWTSILPIIPETLIPPVRGVRDLEVIIRLCDIDALPTVSLGQVESGAAVHEWRQAFQWTFAAEGYSERISRLEATEEAIVCLAIALAFSDGKFHATEGDVIKAWIRRRLALLGESEREARKKHFNGLVQEVYAECKAKTFPLQDVIDALKSADDAGAAFEAVELCLDVMSADGRASEGELASIDDLAQALDVDSEAYANLKHRRLMDVDHPQGTDVDYYSLLSINREWSLEQIRSHLNSLYDKWNARAESLADSDKRAKAEQMMTYIAEARVRILV